MRPIHCPLPPPGLYQKRKTSRRIIRNALGDRVDHVWVPPEFTFCGAKQGNEDLNMAFPTNRIPSQPACDPIHPKTKSPDEHSGDGADCS